MSGKKFSINSTTEQIENFKDVKGDFNASHGQVLEYLLAINTPKIAPTGAQKIERTILQYLYLGHDRRITQTDIQRTTGANLNTIKKVIALYKDEIDNFNNNLDNE